MGPASLSGVAALFLGNKQQSKLLPSGEVSPSWPLNVASAVGAGGPPYKPIFAKAATFLLPLQKKLSQREIGKERGRRTLSVCWMQVWY